MSKRPKTDLWMPVYIGDYLADTMRLSTIQHGAYFLLMMEYWRQGPLPDDSDELAAIARTDRKTWDKSIWPVLNRYFHKEDDGLLHQKRADAERAFADEKRTKRIEAANARWVGSKSKIDANADANASSLDEQNGMHDSCKDHPTCASRPPASPSPSPISSLRSDMEEGAQAAPAPPAKPRGRRIPDDWEPDLELRAYATGRGFTADDTARIAETFRDYWRAEAGAKATKLDWDAAFRVWVQKERPTRGSAAPPSSKPQSNLSAQYDRLMANGSFRR